MTELACLAATIGIAILFSAGADNPAPKRGAAQPAIQTSLHDEPLTATDACGRPTLEVSYRVPEPAPATPILL